ncbi:SCO-spondin [Octopus bimaculoides]|uniref:CTCK domain-containing protein n=1 Tax=Octopus bimaculoides TaxID=37653 RepID=A0A0L8FVX9_OCTBM|nr:SCO-spondin [Octopus bimaculoides]
MGCNASYWSEWSPWSNCSSDCNAQKQTRTRICNVVSTGLNKPCEGNSTETKTCVSDLCQCIYAVNVNGLAYIEKDGILGYTNKTEKLSQGDILEEGVQFFQDCNTCTCRGGAIACTRKACLNCAYTMWSVWSKCSLPCGNSTKTRTRVKLTGRGQESCNKELTQTKTCNQSSCDAGCKLYKRVGYIIDGAGCTSNNIIDTSYCSGFCGESSSVPRIMEDANSILTMTNDCKCCTGQTGSQVSVPMTCSNGLKKTVYVRPMVSCSCNKCMNNANQISQTVG